MRITWIVPVFRFVPGCPACEHIVRISPRFACPMIHNAGAGWGHCPVSHDHNQGDK